MKRKTSTAHHTQATHVPYDIVIIGGGFYGASLALALRKHYKNIVILEKEKDLLTQASYVNQATIHNGYHYPRSYLTAMRSRTNFPIFSEEFPEAVFTDYERIYAVASRNSKATARQFTLFCEHAKIPIRLASSQVVKLFNDDMIEAVFSVQEYAFYADKLRDIMKERLAKAKIEVIFQASVDKVNSEGKNVVARLTTGEKIYAKHHMFSAVYGSTGELLARSGLQPLPLKHEMAEIGLIDVPTPLKKLGITVIDGPFWATMPFPMTKYHSFSHVRYTPQKTFLEGEDTTSYTPHSNFELMIRDAKRYLPIMSQAKHIDSLFTIKTTLPQHERDDGRPILYRKDYGIKNFSVILGGKIDNIYDILATMKL